MGDDPTLKIVKAQFYNAIVTQSLLIVMYLGTLVRMIINPATKLNFVVFISVLLMLSNIFWVWYTGLIL